MLVEKVEHILSMDVEAVISSPASIDLIRCYSILWYDSNPRWCAKSQRSYYELLRTKGLEKAKKYDMATIRTCEPKHKGTFLVRNYGHIISDMMTDEQAIYLLNNKLLNESDFNKLPEGYISKQIKVADVVDEVIEEVAEQPATEKPKRTRKTKK